MIVEKNACMVQKKHFGRGGATVSADGGSLWQAQKGIRRKPIAGCGGCVCNNSRDGGYLQYSATMVS